MSGPRQEHGLVEGAAGNIEVFMNPVDAQTEARGVALIAHPHPLFGGTAENKVVTTLAKALGELGYITLRPNFRGVGASSGSHDQGVGESDDLLAVHAYARTLLPGAPVVLAGYSFGAYVTTRLAQMLAAQGQAAQRLILVGMAAGVVPGARSYDAPAVPADTLVIHGDVDDTVPLANVLAWARPQELPVVVIPGADHFFHRKLHLLRAIVHNAWHS